MTQDELKQILHYDSITGIFTWLKPSKFTKIKIGDMAGCLENSYRKIKIDGNAYKEHRLAWLYVYGYLPTKMIDHINGDTLDNSIENLREVTGSENQQNRGKQKNNSSGYKGVTKCGNKWRSEIQVNGKKIYQGTFHSPEEASEAYKKAALIYHPFAEA